MGFWNKMESTMSIRRSMGGVIVVVLLCGSLVADAQNISVAKQLAATAMGIWKDSGSDAEALRWTYEQGVVWMGMMRLWYSTGDAR